MTLRKSQNPKRRLARPERLGPLGREELAARLVYTGSALHKRHPGDYGFQPPVNPRSWKSLCDGKKVILNGEAAELLRQGALNGFFSDFPDGQIPKYVWSVDSDGEVYEAKSTAAVITGIGLEEEDDFRTLILKEWAKRCGPR